MANAPFTWGSQGPKSLQSGGVELTNGVFLRNDGAKNYITYNSAETNTTTGWSLGTATLTSVFPSGAPTFGSGANANLSFAASATNPLSGTYSYTLVSSAATTAGNFVASDAFTVDAADKAKVLTIKFSYEGSSNPANANWSGTSSNSWGIAIYDVTASQWIMPAGVWGLTQSLGVGTAVATFQTNASSSQYRLVIFNANATSGAVTLKLDDFFIGRQTAPIGAVATDWQEYTPSITATTTAPTLGTTTYNKAYWRRVGDSMQIFYGLRQTAGGSAGSGTYLFALPSGFTMDANKVPYQSTTVVPTLGSGTLQATSLNSRPIITHAYDATRFRVLVLDVSGANMVPWSSTVGPISDASVQASFTITVPISGWSSNVQMSNDTDTRIVAAIISGDPASASSGNPIIVPTVSYDSHAAYNATTGRYTCPVTGIYKIYGALQSASSATTLTIYKNAVSTALAGNLDSNGEATFCGAVNCNAGDIIDLRPGGTVDATNMTLNIERLSGPAVVAATETVVAQYRSNGGQSIANGSTTVVVDFNLKDWDSHNAVSGTGSGWRFTAPVSGTYRISAMLTYTNAAFTKNTSLRLVLQKSGSDSQRLGHFGLQATDTYSAVVQGTSQVRLLAGEYIAVGTFHSESAARSLDSNSLLNFITIERIGN